MTGWGRSFPGVPEGTRVGVVPFWSLFCTELGKPRRPHLQPHPPRAGCHSPEELSGCARLAVAGWSALDFCSF